MSMRIGGLASLTGCPVVTIRYYEAEGLLPSPMRSGGNYRLYDDAHAERLQFIRQCRSFDMSLAEVRVLLHCRETPTQDCAEVNALLDQHIERVEARVRELQLLCGHLNALRRKCSGQRDSKSCGILRGLSDREVRAARSTRLTSRSKGSAGRAP